MDRASLFPGRSPRPRWLALAVLLAAGAGSAPARATAADREGAVPEPDAGPASRKVASRVSATPETANAWKAKHGLYFKRNWGIDVVGVRRVASGMMLRFDYRVVDPDRAAALTNSKARPYIVDEKTRTALAVPAMENIGELRQVAPLEHDRVYYVIFGNPGGLVKKGGRVTLVVGNFKAEGMVVE